MNECPYCEKEINYSNMYRDFMSGVWDWQIMFTMDCPHCHLALEVEVESIPEFIYHKPEERIT